jgi:hypothetical protein
VVKGTDRPRFNLSIGGQPLVSIGRVGGDPAYEFSMIAGVSRMSGNRWAIANLSTSEIRVFDSTGKHLRSMGRRGRGPGEFPFLWQMWRVADTLIGVDGAGLSQVFTLDGTFLRSLPRPSAAGRPVERFGYLADGSYIGGYLDPEDESKLGRSVRWITLVKRTDQQTTALGRFRAREMARKRDGEPLPVVYGGRVEVAVLPRNFCVGYSATFAFTCFDEGGKSLVSVRMDGLRPLPVTEADRQGYFDGIDKGNPGPRGAKYRTEVRAVTEFADHLPAFGRFVASAAQELWVGPLTPADATVGSFNPAPDQETVWRVFDMRGAWLAEVTLPARFRLMEAGADYVAGVSRDSDDVERVVVYRLYGRT